jgi:hypothetical protein
MRLLEKLGHIHHVGHEFTKASVNWWGTEAEMPKLSTQISGLGADLEGSQADPLILQLGKLSPRERKGVSKLNLSALWVINLFQFAQDQNGKP